MGRGESVGALVIDGGVEGIRVIEGGILEGVGLKLARVGVSVMDLDGTRVKLGVREGVTVIVNICVTLLEGVGVGLSESQRHSKSD